MIIPSGPTSARPSPADGSAYVDTSLGRMLLLSDGSVWRNVKGATINPGAGTPGPVLTTPAQVLDIGLSPGQNHFNVGIGWPSGHIDYEPTQIASGYAATPEFCLNAAHDAVQFRVRMDGAKTSTNTKYPRSELREYAENGTAKAAFNGASGTHRMQGISRITHLPPVKPWVVFAQLHDASSDLMRLQTEGTSTTALKLVMRNTPPGSSTETVKTVQASYTLGTDIKWKIEVINGAGTLYINGVSVGTFPAGASGLYYKAGCYPQSNNTIDTAAEYAAVELREFQTWHTGYATPNPIVVPGTGLPPDPGGGPPAPQPPAAVDAAEVGAEALPVRMFHQVPVPAIDLIVEATGRVTRLAQVDLGVEPLPMTLAAEVRYTPTIREVLTAVRLYSDSTDTVTLTTGVGTAAGDTVVAIYGLDYGDANQSPGPGPGDWVQQALASASDVSPHIKVWTRRLAAGGAQTINLTHTDIYADASLVVLVLTGVNEQQPVSMWAAGAGRHATQHVANSITPVDKDELLVTAYMAGPNANDMGNYTAPAGMTKRAEVDAPTYSTLAVCTQALNSNATTGSRSATFARSVSPGTATAYASLTMGFRGNTPTSSSTQVSVIGLTSELFVSKSVTVPLASPMRTTGALDSRKRAALTAGSPLDLESAPAAERDVRTLPAGGPIDLSLWALDDTGAYLGPLPDAISIQLSPVISAPGGVQVIYPADGVNFGLLHDMITDDRDLEIAIWVGGREDGSLRAVLTESDGDEVNEHAQWTFSGTFLEGRMSEAVTWPNPADPKQETHFENVTAGAVIRTLMVAAQSRGTLTDITFDSFTNTAGSNGARFTKTVTLTLHPGQTYLGVLGDLVEVGLCEWEMDGHALKLYEPETRGVDRSLEWPPIALRAGKDLTDSPRKHSVRESPTVLLAAGKDGIYTNAADAAAQVRRGRRIESFVSQGSIDDAGALLAYAQAALGGRAVGTMELSQGLAFAPGGPLPIADFDRFDWVLSDNGNGLERLRVAQWTIIQDNNGRLTGSAVLNDLIADRQAKLAKQLASLQSGTLVVGTSTPAAPGDDVLAPKAPTGVVASSVPYQNVGTTGTTEAAITVGWTPVTLNTDGTALDDLDGYRVQYRYLGLSQVNNTPSGPLLYGSGAGGWQYVGQVTAGSAATNFSGVTAGVDIEVQVAAVDRAGNQSAWSQGFSLTTAQDMIPPAQTSIPLSSEYLGTIRVSWDGLDAHGQTMAPDFTYAEVHLSTTRNFTPDETTYQDRLFGAGGTVITDVLYQVSYFAKLVPVDLAGNKGEPSGEGVAVPQPVVSDDVFEGAIGSEKLADLAVIRAKIADLAVNSAKIADLSVGKLTAGKMIADILLAGSIKTAVTGARIELDGTGFRQFNAQGQLRTQFLAGTGDALLTGTVRSAMTGKRWEMQPDGSLRLYPVVGQNYSQFANYGNDVAWRGPLDSNRMSGRINVNTFGIGMNFSSEDDLTTLYSEHVLFKGRITSTTPLAQVRVDRRYPADNGTQRAVYSFNNTSGSEIANSVLTLQTFAGGAPDCPAWVGSNVDSGLKWDLHQLSVINGAGSFGPIQASAFPTASSISLKSNVEDIPAALGGKRAIDVVRGARAKKWNYTHELKGHRPPKPGGQVSKVIGQDKHGKDIEVLVDADWAGPEPDAPTNFGPIAEELRAVAPQMLTFPPDSTDITSATINVASMAGVAWAAAADNGDDIAALRAQVTALAAQVDALTKKPK